MTSKKPAAPTGLGTRGRGFWRWTVENYTLSTPETQLLTEVCRTLDVVEDLEAQVRADGRMVEGSRGQQVVHPALAEVRQSRALLGRLLAQLNLPDLETGGSTIFSPLQARGRQGAAARWGSRGTA